MLGEDGFNLLVRREFTVGRVAQTTLDTGKFGWRGSIKTGAKFGFDLARHPLKLVLSVRRP